MIRAAGARGVTPLRTGSSVATKRQVETKLRQLIGRLHGADEGVEALAKALPEAKVIEVVVPDLDQTYWTKLEHGRMGPLHPGAPDRADIRLEAGSDVLVEIVDGERSLFSSYVAGRVKVEASFADLLRLRKLA